MIRIPKEFQILHGKVLAAYMYPYDEKHRYCVFGHSYPHMHFIIEANGHIYLVCGAEGQYLLLDSILDDIIFMLETKIVDPLELARKTLVYMNKEKMSELKKTIDKYYNEEEDEE